MFTHSPMLPPEGSDDIGTSIDAENENRESSVQKKRPPKTPASAIDPTDVIRVRPDGKIEGNVFVIDIGNE